jgi:photosystem II stability/assembly factor-like uncharacterized protein
MPEAPAADVHAGDRMLLVGTMKGRSSSVGVATDSGSRPARTSRVRPCTPSPTTTEGDAYACGPARRAPSWARPCGGATTSGAPGPSPGRLSLRFPPDAGLTLKQIWQITPGGPDDPGLLYCGVNPSSLFESRDGGETWSLVRGLHDHPHRAKWTPGNGGLCLHTILLHPQDSRRILVATSTGGVYRTQDGGRSWQASNQGIRAQFLPEKYPEFGQCVHKVVRHPDRPDRYFLQNHWGLYRSDDGGASWKDVANGVPSDFGFAMAMHPRDPDTVYIVPLESDSFRCTPGARLRVYRTRDAGASWKPLTRGLPQKHAWETVLRDGLTTDAGRPAGIHFGTRSGKVYASRDEGEAWQCLAEGLPPVTCVRAAMVGAPARRATRATRARRAARRRSR